jgi:holin-like protein
MDALLGGVVDRAAVNGVHTDTAPDLALPAESPRPAAAGRPAPALVGFAVLLACQLAGELLARALTLPWPGPVLGIALVLALLALGWAQAPIAAACDVLLSHLSLLFVPVGVGVITHLDELAAHGAALVVVLLLSTWIGLAVTALTLRLLLPR